MKKARPALVLLFVLVATLYSCWPAHAFAEGDIYRVTYECHDLRGNPRWKATAEIRHVEGDIYTITEKLNGLYYGFDGKISWVAETKLERAKDTVRPLSMNQQIFDQSGRLIAVRKQEFNIADKSVTCTSEDLIKNTSATERFAFNKDIINRLLQGLYVQKFLENGETSRRIQLVSPEPALYDIELRVVGVEEIELNGKKRKAYKLVFDPQLGLLNFVKILLPKAYVWHSAEPRFELLKYQGIETSIHSPEVEILTLESGIVHRPDSK